jgi:hypothetical protein
MVVATVIVVDTTMMASISLFNNVAASIITKSDLASGAMAAPAVGGLADTSMEPLRSFTKETLANTIRLLAFDCTIELFLLKESLKKSRDGLDGLVVKRFSAQDELLAVVLVVRHVVPLKRKLIQRFQDVARLKKLGNAGASP